MRKSSLTFEEVKNAAHGKWSSIIHDVCGGRLDEAVQRTHRRHGDCPVHGSSSKPPFRLFKDFEETGGVVCSQCGMMSDGFKTIAWLNGITSSQAKWRVAESLGLKPRSRDSHAAEQAPEPPPPPPVEMEPVLDHAEQAKQSKWWSEAFELTHPKAAAARRYLHKRGLRDLDSLPVVLKLHPGMGYWEADESGQYHKVGTYPCILAMVVRPTGKVATLHRTFITERGEKAPVLDVKKLRPAVSSEPLTGSFIPLYRATTRVLGLTEGIETALAIRQATGMPVWACVSAPLLKGVHVPDSVDRVVIWADKDRSGDGMKYAKELGERLAKERPDVVFRIEEPPMSIPDGKKGVDWLDFLLSRGAEHFPYRLRSVQQESTSGRRRPTELRQVARR